MPRIAWTPPANAPAFPIEVALSYARAGIPVFPCREEAGETLDPTTGEFEERKEKTPYTIFGLKDATRTERIIERWWSDHPRAVVGIPTGEGLGAWVLDLDRHEGRDGLAWLAEMEAKHGPLPETARATTANDGLHIFFTHVDGVRNRGALAPGVDTRGQGGYIVGPGSVMADGRKYEWVDFDGRGLPSIADAPDWLLELVVAKEAPQAQQQPYHYESQGNEPYVTAAVRAELDKLATTPTGGRGTQLNTSAFSLGTLVGAGVLDRSTAESELYAAAVACGVAKKDGERTTRANIKRAVGDGMRQPRQVPERQTDPGWRVDVSGMINKSKAATPEPANDDAPKVPAQPERKERGRFELTWFDNIEEGVAKETFIKGVFGVREFTTVSGLPGTGKSVIVTDAACHVAAGMEWHGRKVKPGLVVYVAAERKKLTERRMLAFRIKHGVKNVPLLVLGGRLDFTKDLRDAKELIAAIRQAEQETELECVWVIIDTLTRVFGAGDQNASKDMTKFVQACDEILDQTKAHVTAIHHSSWSGERGKGAIDLDGAVDASFMVKKSSGKFQFICDGTNDGEEGEVLAFAMESVEIGVDEDGEPTTAPVVVKVASDGVGKGLVEARTHKDKALAILREMLEDGEPSPGTNGFPESGRIVPCEAWRNAFYDSMGDATQPTKQATFTRVKKNLIERKKIGEQGQWVWPIAQPSE